MREYYIFNIKEEFAKLYKERQGELFYIFNRIYYMKEIDKEYGYNLFAQIGNFYDKKIINEFIYNRHRDKIMYSNNENEHIINNLFLNEISVLTVKNSNIRIETNYNKCTFLKDLKYFSSNLFVCDFKEHEYFFIKSYKTSIKN